MFFFNHALGASHFPPVLEIARLEGLGHAHGVEGFGLVTHFDFAEFLEPIHEHGSVFYGPAARKLGVDLGEIAHFFHGKARILGLFHGVEDHAAGGVKDHLLISVFINDRV